MAKYIILKSVLCLVHETGSAPPPPFFFYAKSTSLRLLKIDNRDSLRASIQFRMRSLAKLFIIVQLLNHLRNIFDSHAIDV